MNSANIFPEYEQPPRDECAFCFIFESTQDSARGLFTGPSAVAHASVYAELYDVLLQRDPMKPGIWLEKTDHQNMTDTISRAIDDGMWPVMIGAGRQSTLSAIKALPENTSLMAFYGTAFRSEKEQEIFNSTDVFMAGTRALSTRCLTSSDISGTRDVMETGMAADSIESFVDMAGTGSVLVSIDLDVLAPSVLMNGRSIEPGGMKYDELTSLLRTVFERTEPAGVDITGTKDIVQDTPAALLAVELLIHIAAMAQGIKEK